MKIAIVGTGNVARKNYLPYLSHIDDVELSYYNRTREKAESCAEEFGGRVAGSIADLMNEDPDAVLVLTAETCRDEVTKTILDHGPKRLFFEKPLVARKGQANVTEDDFFAAKALLLRSAERGVETAMIFNYRFFEQMQHASALIAERDFGALEEVSLFVNYACWSHAIDLLSVFGGSAVELTALGGATEHKGAIDVAGAFGLSSGATGTIIGTNATHFDSPLYRIVLCFERGIVEFNDLDGPMTLIDSRGRFSETRRLLPAHSRWTQYAASFERSLEAYLASIRSGTAPPVPGVAGLRELQFEAALRRSIAERRPVDVRNEFDLGGLDA